MSLLTASPRLHVPVALWPATSCILVFCALMAYFRYINRRSGSFYFDPQDLVYYEEGGGRQLPVAASTGTFAAHLTNYLDVIKLLITVAAASIAFAGGQAPPQGVFVAKVILSFSILYGVAFGALLQFFYDDYCQNVRAYTPFRYSLIEALGFAALICFIAGYFAWALNTV